MITLYFDLLSIQINPYYLHKTCDNTCENQTWLVPTSGETPNGPWLICYLIGRDTTQKGGCPTFVRHKTIPLERFWVQLTIKCTSPFPCLLYHCPERHCIGQLCLASLLHTQSSGEWIRWDDSEEYKVDTAKGEVVNYIMTLRLKEQRV